MTGSNMIPPPSSFDQSDRSRSSSHGRRIMFVDTQLLHQHQPQQQLVLPQLPIVEQQPEQHEHEQPVYRERPRMHETGPGDDPLLGRPRPRPRPPSRDEAPQSATTNSTTATFTSTGSMSLNNSDYNNHSSSRNNNNGSSHTTNNNQYSSRHMRVSAGSKANNSTASQNAVGANGRQPRRSSLELRKLPVPSVLFSANQSECTELHEDDSFVAHAHVTAANDSHNRPSNATSSVTHRSSSSTANGTLSLGRRCCCCLGRRGRALNFNSFLRRTCLNSKFNLRTQMMLSFGIVSAAAILLVVIVCIAVSVMCGKEVAHISHRSFADLIRSKEGTTARYLAESLTLRLLPLDLVQLLYEATRDRFAGYPTYENDSRVPFFDIESQSNRYPIKGPPLPLDWEIVLHGGNVNATTHEEHVQSRYKWYQPNAPLSTENAAFLMQGSCNPNATKGQSTYWEDCTDANNNVTAGGRIAPTPTSAQIYRKAADLAPLLKSLYEFYADVKEIGIYFSNSGAGATMVFPHYPMNTTSTYKSIGCSWLLQPHPYDSSRYVGSLQDHARCEGQHTGGAKIHEAGQPVSVRLYSPMDRAWCRNQAMNPEQQAVIYGPYQNAFLEGDWLMSIGRAVYDRVTNEFVGCISIDYGLDAVTQAVYEKRVTANSAVTLARWDDKGTVVASSKWNSTANSQTVTVDELKVGMSHESFVQLKQLVDYDNAWEPETVRQTYEDFHVQDDGYLISAYPIPPPPDAYDPKYRPEFFAISSLSRQDIVSEVENVGEAVTDTVGGLVSLSLMVGLAGLAAVVLFIFVVSHAITLPLKYMNDVSSDIVNTFGSHKEDGIEMSHTKLDSKCTPKTELNDVVVQFQKMVSRFSGSAMARSMQVNVNEIDNQFSMEGKFCDLYYARDNKDFPYSYAVTKNNQSSSGKSSSCSISDKLAKMDDLSKKKMDDYSSSIKDKAAKEKEQKQGSPPPPKKVLQRIHFGSVINDGNKSEATTFRTSDVKWGNGTSLTSPLFFWIVALIVTPLLITTVSISTFVTYSISQGLFDIIHETQAEYIVINDYALLVQAEMRATYAALAMRQSIRDNFLLARYSSWMLFGGLERSDSYTEMIGGTDQCKTYPIVEQCPAYHDFHCDCKWNDRFGKRGSCDDYEVDTRYLQKSVFYGLAENAEPDGDRPITHLHNYSRSPEETLWWSNMSHVPGAHKGSNASGYETTYDRLRVGSAFPFFHTFYNADLHKGSFQSSALFYEADGLGIGYGGCSPDILLLSRWSSTESNGASALRPDLCPLGKFGYDPRCRAWYDKGRRLAMENNTGLYVTPPYHFAGYGEFYGQTCTSPLIDPKTGEHVGQTLVDFLSLVIFEALKQDNTPLADGGFPFVITGMSDWSGADTVIGPGWSLVENSSAPIGDILLPNDKEMCPFPFQECQRRASFEKIRDRMKNGKMGNGNFVRTKADGTEESIHLAFAPVKAKVIMPVDSSDFTRGINESDFLVYSLALAEPENGLLEPFEDVEAQVHKQIATAIVVLALVIVISTAFVLYISNRLTLSMAEPMIYLLQLIVHLNRTTVEGSPPGLEVDKSYGSREIVNVVGSIETLYRIVQAANVAFYAGDIEKAYFVLADAARLFRRLENSKAEGVANNNLGNTMLVFIRTMEDTGADEVCGFSKREIIGKGMGYYHRAIQLGEKAYDSFYEEEGWSPSCLEFMQHLSNRYFNRAMFLLTVKDGHERPAELEELGLRDLQIATDMDVEIVDQGTEVGWDVRGADKLFDVVLSRVRGHLLLLEMGYGDKWDVDELLDNAFGIVKKELHCANPGASPLFKEFCPAGRMQQIETELMRYKMVRGDFECAAKIAIRMLVEDEKTIQSAQLKAVEVLVTHAKIVLEDTGSRNPSQLQALRDLEDYQDWLRIASNERDRRSTCGWEEEALPETLKKSVRRIMSDSERGSKAGAGKSKEDMKLSSLRASTKGDVTMEVF